MVRLLVHVEGQTEETFVNEVLRPHLYDCGFTSVSARMLGNARSRVMRGGILGWAASQVEIARHLREDQGAHSTTLVDFYGLPSQGDGSWPGCATCPQGEPMNAHNHLQTEIHRDFRDRHGDISDRFIPFVAFHEFEGLLFSDPAAMAKGMGSQNLQEQFENIRNGFESPEHINNSPVTAPSKRITALMPGYQKPFHGILAALEITLPRIRNACPVFNSWLNQLEAIP